jgi:CheY-like chemotaxis protein
MARILVVDDEPDVRELVELLLAGPDRHIEGADGGRAALERLAAHPYDLIVSDLRMPEVDGIQIFLPSSPIISTFGSSPNVPKS